jgi:hypothetical protein
MSKKSAMGARLARIKSSLAGDGSVGFAVADYFWSLRQQQCRRFIAGCSRQFLKQKTCIS